MIERVNHTAGEMINRGRSIVSRLGEHRKVKNGSVANAQRAGAKRALKVIEAVKGTAGRWR